MRRRRVPWLQTLALAATACTWARPATYPIEPTYPNELKDVAALITGQKFLADHERLNVPGFSISAVSTKANTAKILQGLWDHVTPFALDKNRFPREALIEAAVRVALQSLK